MIANTQQPRRLVHFSGVQAECIEKAQTYVNQHPQFSTLPASLIIWLTDLPLSQAVAVKKAPTLLGQEFAVVVIDAFSGFSPNALAIAGSTLCGGGVLIVLTPPLSVWSRYADPDYQRFLPYPYQPNQVQGLFLARFIRFLEQGLPPFRSEEIRYQPEQQQALLVDHVLAILQNQQQRVVLTADRGRGKSAALGLIASELMRQGRRVIITAPARATTQAVFKHASLPPAFYAPDELLSTLPPADVVLVDEAAAIPIALLLQLATHYSRCVFATTIQGYEGSGRGFVLRFQQQLQQQPYPLTTLQLHLPMRWPVNDPLEQWLNRVLLLDVASTPSLTLRCLQPHYACLKASELAQNERLLRQVFGLLVAAHYQTRPSDLRQLLDAPNLSIHVLRQGDLISAVALLSREGGFAEALSAAIQAGQRRPHGHLVPQTLTFHAGIAQAACLVCERVMRIAVHPALQRKGLGRLLLAQLVAYSQTQAADYVAVSYAFNPALKAFWDQADFQLARIGQRRDTASGTFSIVQVLALNTAGQHLVDQLPINDNAAKLAALSRIECDKYQMRET